MAGRAFLNGAGALWTVPPREPPLPPPPPIAVRLNTSPPRPMKLAIPLVALVLAALTLRFALARARRKHDPLEYYLGWGGYRHPITPENRITKEAADVLAARGAAYLIGYFDGDRRLTRAIKMYRGEVFFDYLYRYHPNGRLKSASVTRGGRVTVLEYDARGRRVSDASIAF
jgi:hypothetical protein